MYTEQEQHDRAMRGVKELQPVMADLNKELKREESVRKRPDLIISRVPDDTRAKFLELAEQFKSTQYPSPDFGMALKWLIDLYYPMALGFSDRIEALETRVLKLENQPEKTEEKKTIRTVDGKIHEVE